MSKWPWPDYLDGAPDPLYGWDVPEEDLDLAGIRHLGVVALSHLSKVHKILTCVPDLDVPYGGASTNTARVRMEDTIKEARKQLHIAFTAMNKIIDKEEQMQDDPFCCCEGAHIPPIEDVEEVIMEEYVEDNWKHRSSNMVCETCMFYVPKVNILDSQELSLGRCRRHAPTMGGFPVVYYNDWCGDHKVDEEKI
jgi:hypothetical protein